LSKLIAPGLRLGFVSGPQKIIERVIYQQMGGVMNPSVIAQVMVHDLLTQWGPDGLEQHIKRVEDFYRKQRDLMLEAATKWLTGLGEWSVPDDGLFLWIKLLGFKDTKKFVEEKLQQRRVGFIPGYAFMINRSNPSPYIRASFSLSTPEHIDLGFKRLSEAIVEELNEIRQTAE